MINEENINKIKIYIQDNLAQKDSKYDRLVTESESSHMGGIFETRCEFGRDIDRILYSKSFRRLQHKAQVYSNEKSDHYRTRLTHTLEVNQISKSISRNLGLNVNLTEAIALGHDIGHTPFGHVGEEVLDDIMRGHDDLGKKLVLPFDYGGFKHNFNSLKILDSVEEKSKGYGLNLTWQVLDGILKHTSIVKPGKNWDLKRFVDDFEYYRKFIYYGSENEEEIKFTFPLTLEGQIVAISDEIAQRSQDLDDSLRNKDFSFGISDLYNKILEIICSVEKSCNSDDEGFALFLELKKSLYDLKDVTNEIQWQKMISIIISYFIRDVTETTMLNLEKEDLDNIIKFEEINENYCRKYIVKDIVSFSKVGNLLNEKIENFINNKIIYSFNVSRFDGKAKYIVRQLFKAYYENPRQMPKKHLDLINIKIEKVANIYGSYKLDDGTPIEDVKFNINSVNKTINNKHIDDLITILKLNDFEYPRRKSKETDVDENLNKSIENIMKMIDIDLIDYQKRDDFGGFTVELFSKIGKMDKNSIIDKFGEENEFSLLIKFLFELHYIYLSVICNYISQMTDNYAKKEFKELYLV